MEDVRLTSQSEGATVIPVSYRIQVDFDDPKVDAPDQPFTITVKQGEETIETFPGLTMATAAEKVNAESKTIMITDDVKAKIGQALIGKKIEKSVAKQRAAIRAGFAEIIEAARPPAGDTQQVDPIKVAVAGAKLRVFNNHAHRNPELAMKLAQMNRAQRQAFFSDLTHERGAKKRAAIRKQKIKARKGKR